jgi:hypothetical protein
MPGRRHGRRTPAALLRARSPWLGPVLALVVLVSGTVSELRTAPPASGSTLPSAAKKPAKPARAKPGVGLRSRDGWAGTWSVNGKQAFGIDLDSRDPSTATGYTGTPAKRVHRQVGWSKNHRKGGADAVRGPTLSSQDLDRLAYLADRYAGARSATTTAAAEHAVLAITAVDKAQATREKARWSAVVRAQPAAKATYDAVAADARDHAGPYTLTTAWTTAPSAFTPGGLAVQLVSAAGKPMTGMRITGRYLSAPGAASITATTDAKGGTTLNVPVKTKGAIAVTLTAADLPNTVPVLYTPKRFRDRRSPDHIAQRLIGAAPRTSVGATATASVAAAVPLVTTHANPATPALTSRLTDDITLTGTVPAYAGRIAASLWGPFPASPAPGDCNTLTAKLAARVAVDVSGDGTVTTPPVTVVSPGYYTWVEDVPGTPLQDEVLTTCGDQKETFIVPGTPSLSLAVTGDRVPGGDLEADLTIRGSFPHLAADPTLTLYGPFPAPPIVSSCTAGAVADTTTTTVQDDGTVVAATVTAGTTGYYSWTVSLPSVTKMQAAASIVCGDPRGVFAVNRPDIGALDVTSTGSVGATDPGPPPPPGGPLLSIGSVSVAAPLVSVPLNPPGIAVPSDYSLAGEVDIGAHVGDAWGTVVVAGRVGDVHGVHGALYDASHVAAGAAITLTDVNGLTGHFTVTSVTTQPRTDVLPASLFAQTGPLRLVILTTTDPVFFGGGLITYRSHVIVTATAN